MSIGNAPLAATPRGTVVPDIALPLAWFPRPEIACKRRSIKKVKQSLDQNRQPSLRGRKYLDQAGCHAIILDVMSDGGEATFEKRKAWYQGFGFQSFASNDARMFMTMKQVRTIVEQ